MRAWRPAIPILVLLVSAARATAEPRSFDLHVAGGELPEASRVIRVQQDDVLTLRWTTDAPLVVHLHGYDVELALTPSAPATMKLHADVSGRFPIEVHGAGAHAHGALAYLEVHPR